MFFNFEKFYKIRLPKKKIFIDVGANTGDWFTKAKKKYKNSRIYAFEPIKGITKKRKDVKIIIKAIDLKNGLLTKIFNLFLISGNLFLNNHNITNIKIKINIVLIILN